ncbi:hypothetical protein DN53_10580 [Flagellimonas olearia]|uniref:DUF2911 domain-containing protein n=1 Tax=Flagellimonas olearia TaxID=552546 RepID=A0A444VNP0_9FLAO|nr:hypothetical protein DN53_10580 [Allomuricauda olearia]
MALLLCIPKSNHAQLQIPDMSPRAELLQTIGYTQIRVDYSRPSLRGRTLLGNDGILPYGQLWRTGANGTTMISFSSEVILGDQKVSGGQYAVLSVPDKGRWTINLYPYSSSNWTDYVDREPLIRISQGISAISVPVESFEFSFQNIGMEKMDLVMEWGTISVSLPIMVNAKEEALNKIDKALAGPSDFDYFLAGLYLHEANHDLERALDYVQKASKKDNALFFQVHREALILKDLGRNSEALVAARKSLELSRKIENQDFIRLNEKMIGELMN